MCALLPSVEAQAGRVELSALLTLFPSRTIAADRVEDNMEDEALELLWFAVETASLRQKQFHSPTTREYKVQSFQKDQNRKQRKFFPLPTTKSQLELPNPGSRKTPLLRNMP